MRVLPLGLPMVIALGAALGACSAGGEHADTAAAAARGAPASAADSAGVAAALAEAIASDLRAFSGDTSPATVRLAEHGGWDSAVVAALQARRPRLVADSGDASARSLLLLPRIRVVGDTIVAQAVWRRCAEAARGTLGFEQDSIEYRLVRSTAGDAWEPVGSREVTHSVGDCQQGR